MGARAEHTPANLTALAICWGYVSAHVLIRCLGLQSSRQVPAASALLNPLPLHARGSNALLAELPHPPWQQTTTWSGERLYKCRVYGVWACLAPGR